jgi:hypothetical protein
VRDLGDLGAALRELNRPEEAEPLVRRSLALRRDLLPAQDPAIVASLNNLSRILVREGRFAEAEEAAQEAARLRRGEAAAIAQADAWLATVQALRYPVVRLQGLLLPAAGWAAGLAALLTAIAAARRTPSDNLRRLLAVSRWLTLAFATGMAGWIGARVTLVAVETWLPGWAGDLARAAQFGGLLAAGGSLALAVALSGAVFGVALVPRADAAALPNDEAVIRRAITRGRLLINLPVACLIVGTLLLGVVTLAPLDQPVEGVRPAAWLRAAAALGWLMLSIAAGWVWWSIAVPPWRLWCLRNVCDLETLYRRAVNAQLIWHQGTRIGRLMSRTEWWTAAQRREAKAITANIRANPAGPSS